MTRRPRPAPRLAAVVACAGAALAVAVAAVGLLRRGYYRVEVAGRSMHPALQPGDYLVIRRRPPAAGAAAFGTVAALRDPQGRLLLKRIVGLPGEALRVGASVQVNGRVLIEPYAGGTTPPAQFRGLNRLGDDEFFLLGDRRDASTDSRDFGPVPRGRIDGVAVARYWPPRRAGRLARPRRELAGTGHADTAVPEGIVGASRALTMPFTPSAAFARGGERERSVHNEAPDGAPPAGEDEGTTEAGSGET